MLINKKVNWIAFLTNQFSYLMQSFRMRNGIRSKFYIFLEALAIPVKYLQFIWSLKAKKPLKIFGKKCVVILLSHNRPQNLHLLVRAALKNDFIEKVIVSNSNFNVRISEWIKCNDPRLKLIDETKDTQPGVRFCLAQEEDSRYYLAIDDDVFLTPVQYRKLFNHLIEEVSIPHGVIGHIYKPGTKSTNGSPFYHISSVNTKVDVLIGVYAFTRDHLKNLLALCDNLDMGPLHLLRNGEDILLSVSGKSKPKIHEVGRLWQCKSAGIPGVALWKTHRNFWEERIQIIERAREASQN